MDIPIILKLNGLCSPEQKHDILEIETRGIFICIDKKYYMVTVHQGLPVKKITFNIKDIEYNFTDFTICGWNDLIVVPITFDIDLFVFKHFVKKQINHTTKYSIDSNIVNYMENELIPINMMPSNPSNLYYKMKSIEPIIRDGDCGKPIVDSKNKLIGIVCKTNDLIIYTIPSIYILQSINKLDNSTIYTINDIDSISKINNYNIRENNTIYFNKINCLIPIETYIVFEGDKDIKITITTNKEREGMKTRLSYIKKHVRVNVIPFVNLIPNSTDINIDNRTIHINSCFIHMMKLCYKDNSIVQNIFENMEEHKRFEYTINGNEYNLVY